jgi:hypothetical protein
VVRLAVISDLHAYDQTPDGSKPSHFCARDSGTFAEQHPIAGLQRLIEEERLAADMLLVPGDLGDQADPVGVKVAWDAVQSIAKAFGNIRCLATAGNHDLDSRFRTSDYDARGFLQSLLPRFPIDDEREWDRYWSRHYAISETGETLVVALNSCAYHGHAVIEIEHGRVSQQTVSDLVRHVRTIARKPCQILLCHHHPQQHMELQLGEADVMRGGQMLLDALGDGTLGRWLIVHGHKHHPKVTYAAGSATSPVIISSASFSVSLYRDLQTRTRNQFHLIEVADPADHDLGLAGIIRSWEWGVGLGWRPAAESAGLPQQCGFGYRGSPEKLALEIDDTLIAPKMAWSEVVAQIPAISYILPQDFKTLRQVLKADHSIEIVMDSGLPKEVGRSSS